MSASSSGRTHDDCGSSGEEAAEPDVDALEASFEEEYAKHLVERSQQQMMKYGAVGMAISGSLALAAVPFAFVSAPVLAVGALVVGGTSGMNLARHNDMSERSRILKKTGDGTPSQGSSRPSLRRLKFLVKWGYLKFLEDENAAPIWKVIVLDDVIQAFSPWVQQLFLLRGLLPHPHEAPREIDADKRNIEKHLMPLYYFLQRTLTLRAVLEATKLTAMAFQDGSSIATWLSACLDRCRVGFPTILETISTIDKLGPTLAPRTQGHHRLRQIVDEICKTLRLPEVERAIQAGLPSASISPNSVGKAKSLKGCARTLPKFPPEGAEDEVSNCDSNDGLNSADEYFSVADPDDDALRQKVTAELNADLAAQSALEPRDGEESGFEKRCRAFPRGNTSGTWTQYDETKFLVRSLGYMKVKKKEYSKRSLFKLESIDVFKLPTNGAIKCIAEHPECFPAFFWKNNRGFVFILNLSLSPYQAALCGVFDSVAADLSPAASELWLRFMSMTLEEQKKRFKIIVSIEEGPWLVKNICPNTKAPVIPGKVVPMRTKFVPDKFFELSMDITSFPGFQMVFSVCFKQMKRLHISLGCMIEGQSDMELPEAILLSGIVFNMDSTNFLKING